MESTTTTTVFSPPPHPLPLLTKHLCGVNGLIIWYTSTRINLHIPNSGHGCYIPILVLVPLHRYKPIYRSKMMGNGKKGSLPQKSVHVFSSSSYTAEPSEAIGVVACCCCCC
jgi:hypothetical protein